MTPRLEAPGVVLRPLETADAEALFAAHGDAQTHTYWSSPAHKSVEETRQYITDTLAVAGAHAWAITESGGEALGRIALFVQREGVGEIGVIMRPEAAGRGLASKALALVVAHGFGPLGLHRIAADIDPDNANSISLFLRAGFQREGLLRGAWKTHLGIRDSIIMAKLRE
ncbi:MAG: GNAT family N-acetyltransferase [Hyphomonadaceae bacterium]|nr:GNAT family N-acetyltransferase [Hyphomonadaceae bacterium]GIK49198.1 MAG: putative N-acetyltransferase YoaA [Alphaproteobacteria bacterium]